jgi:polyprenyl P-hydroxybenzoate/phenylacrylic acid decarboxylase-like protein
MEIIIGITGATGIIYSIRLLEKIKQYTNINTHLIMSDWAKENLIIETNYTLNYVEQLVTVFYDNKNLSAKISSGSFISDGMIVMPCSMKSLSAIANGYSYNLISRTADVMIKEGRKLILCPRETPLSPIHLENMLKVANLGVKIIPPMPAFYNHPVTLDDVINHHIMKVLDQFEISYANARRWNGLHEFSKSDNIKKNTKSD